MLFTILPTTSLEYSIVLPGSETAKDNLEMPIDPKIKLLVSVLRVLKFTTTGSCSGHFSSSNPYPYVDISSTSCEKFENSKRYKTLSKLIDENPNSKEYWDEYNALCEKPTIENIKEGKRILDLIKDFYKERNTDQSLRLIIESIGDGLGGFRIYPQGSLFIILMSDLERREWLKGAQKEMKDFAYFLANKVK